MYEIKKLIKNSKKITILTGAGISTESGISDFRSPGGVWSRYKTVNIREFISFPEKRRYYWQYKRETIPPMLKAEPNAAHLAIKKLDDLGKLFWLLTQNIDGLHQKSGVNPDKIIRLHGTNGEAICLQCKKIIDILVVLKRLNGGEEDPYCEECGGLLKPNTISFGQSLNPEHLEIARKAAQDCDLFMAVGSSLLVYPACGFVDVACHYKKPVIIINRDPTPYDALSTYCLKASLARVLPLLVQ